MDYKEQLSAVLQHVDKKLDQSLERLQALLRIASISTQPTHKGECRQAAEWLCNELADLGFEASVEEVSWAEPGHPMVVGFQHDKSLSRHRVLFYGHYDVRLLILRPYGQPRLLNPLSGMSMGVWSSLPEGQAMIKDRS